MMPRENSELLIQIKKFLRNAPIITKKRKSSIKDFNPNDFKKSTSKKMKMFNDLFSGKKLASDVNIDDYVDRIAAISNMKGYLLYVAAYLFFKVITKPDLFTVYEDYTIKLFSSCVYLAHKVYLDQQYTAKFMSKLLGIPKKKLNRRELFLCGGNVFNFKFQVDQKNLEKFIKFLKTF